MDWCLFHQNKHPGNTPVTCAGGNNGVITLQASDGSNPYTFSGDNATYGTSNTFGNLKEGVYTFGGRDKNGCTLSISQTVTFQSKLLAAIGSNQAVKCFGGKDGSITVSTTGSSPFGPLQYSIDKGVTFQNSPQLTV